MSSLRSLTQRLAVVLKMHPAVAQKAKKVGWFYAALAALFVVSFAGFRFYRDNYLPLPKQMQPKRYPNPLVAGNPDAAIQQTYKVIELLRAANWDTSKVSRADLHLPDAKYAEAWYVREPRLPSYVTPNRPDGDPSNEPSYKDVACYTPLYTLTSPTYYKGDRAKFKPEGFYIVGWKDGRVTTVPIGDIRWNKGVKEKVVESFPGMPNYDPSGPRLAAVEFADGDQDPARRRAYTAAVSQKPCAGCTP